MTSSSSRRPWAIALVAAEVVVAFVIYRELGHGGLSPQLGSDAAGYRSLVVAAGRPYRDFKAAYPPGALGFFRLLSPSDINVFVRHLILANIVAQLGMTWMCFKGWGARAGWSYLALSLPLMPMLYFRYDLVVADFAVLGLFLLSRRHAVGAGVSWIAGISLKLWPVVLLPGLLARRKTKAFLVSVGLGLMGVVAWVVWGGAGAPGQVLTYGGARGWEFESMPASWLRLFTRDRLRYEEGALRVGAPPKVLGVLLTLVLAGLIVSAWLYVWRHGAVDGVAEVVVVGASLVFGTLLSPQFMIWVVPFVAIAAAGGVVRIERWAAATVVLTFVDWWIFDERHTDALNLELVVAARNIALVGMLVVAIRELLASGRAEPAPQPEVTAG